MKKIGKSTENLYCIYRVGTNYNSQCMVASNLVKRDSVQLR